MVKEKNSNLLENRYNAKAKIAGTYVPPAPPKRKETVPVEKNTTKPSPTNTTTVSAKKNDTTTTVVPPAPKPVKKPPTPLGVRISNFVIDTKEQTIHAELQFNSSINSNID